MQSKFDHESVIDVSHAHLLITDSSARTWRFHLEDNTSFLAGSSANCRIALSGNDVNPIHCRFWLDDNGKWNVQDWNTGGKTMLNGQPIDAAIINTGDELEIGDNRIVLAPLATTAQTGETRSGNEMAQAEQHSVSGDTQAKLTSESIAGQESLVHGPGPDEGVQESACDRQQTDSKNSKFVYDLHMDEADDDKDHLILEPLAFESDHASVNDEVEWLRMEVEQLRYELADRDAQIQATGKSHAEHQSDFEDDPQTVKLVNRLEELLEELQSSDGRIRTLEDLLRASDEATQAEQEERSQLESWVTEIEQRITQRESEAEAGLSRVMQRLTEAQAKTRHAESQLELALESNANAFSDSSNDFIRKLRAQIKDLSRRLEDAYKDNEQLRSEDLDEGSESAAQQIQRLEQKLLQQQVEFSRERAEIARKRAQLEQLKDDLEQKLKSNPHMDDADSRVMAMRQHLRDIHEEEKLEREERKQRSLGGRISSLLNRVSR